MKHDILKKSFIHFVLLVSIILLVTACGGEASTESSPPEEVPLEEATTVPATVTAIAEPTSLPPAAESEPEATDTTVPTATTNLILYDIYQYYLSDRGLFLASQA